ncbi:hypothetical protein MNQ95_11700 [Pseudoxanthomonas daejeonensis]|uniref:hypothetical protein n=1 Tax=Pseudoxanthomonas daejeonensis TaxID=266062 RepID=UPI001F544D67|nr:hypothetical protein [Pseudoxanthomonas daejeonensis]UNK56806.1 hypothetical protein MNQ95_11700 [Pseudoxanthomonas daejeonensis]
MRWTIVASLLAMAGCAGSAHHAALESTDSWCSGQYRAHDGVAPAPANLSDKERGRYDDRTRDYHVSQQCQREAERSVRHRIPDVPRPRVQ